MEVTIAENPIRETADYVLQVGEHEGMSTYQIVNKLTFVTEHTDYLLPRILETVGELQKRLDEVRIELDPEKRKSLELVSSDDEEASDSIH